MKARFPVWVSALVLTLATASGGLAQTRAQAAATPYTPFMLGFVSPLQVPSEEYSVGGLRLNILYGVCSDFDGLDLGFAGRATGHANGLQVGGVNLVEGDGLGLQINALTGYVNGSYEGFQIGVANFAKNMNGLQLGALFNASKFVEGAQVGLINVTEEMIGVQLGLINVIKKNDTKFIPIFNCSF